MRVSLHHLAGVAAMALLLTSADTAQAQGKGHDKKHRDDRAQVRDDDHHRDVGPNDPRYEHRGDYDARYERGRRAIPPGLAKKPGGMPPGQYKKLYTSRQGASVLSDVLGRHGYAVVRSTDAGNSRYVYYRDHAGTVRRAIVTPSGGRLRFSSVPRALLDEINGRLY
jgi:hypothetical protein